MLPVTTSGSDMAMHTSPPPAERRLSSVDVFCMQTYEPAAKDPLRRLRTIALALGLACLVLLGSLAFAVSRVGAMERERDALVAELSAERAAKARTSLAAKDAEMAAASLE